MSPLGVRIQNRVPLYRQIRFAVILLYDNNTHTLHTLLLLLLTIYIYMIDRDSVGSLTSVRLTLGVHSMANSVKNAGETLKRKGPCLNVSSDPTD